MRQPRDRRHLEARLARLTDLRVAEGYMADWSREPDGGFCWSRTTARSAPRLPPARASAAPN